MKECQYYGICGGCSPQSSLEIKIKNASELLKIQDFEVFSLESRSFRARCELGIFHDSLENLHYTMRSNKDFIKIENCINLLPSIQETLPKLLFVLNQKEWRDFSFKLFALEALATQNKEILLTFIYHKPLKEEWKNKALALKNTLSSLLPFTFHIIGRSRGVKLALEQDFVIEKLEILGKEYFYRYDEGAFTQPNPKINEKMIEWILNNIEKSKGDLLEMYCGCGNFTIPLSQKFSQVLATEISKASIQAAKFATEANKVSNIRFVRLSGDECIEAIKRLREFKRLKGICLDDFNFQSVLVDPPRAGLGSKVCEFLSQFKKIIYISCNVASLKEDLEILQKTHKIHKFAFFDQFPNTNHIESGVILHKI
ncbi:tRNA (uridine(54)-C5)-methyltransferase TrmA [Helicobacter burdigaliensis]|uniref:tRNA (uridine(54)-C5)-methyltransferase TrmA n=1 Tax=Helicobacter burdigaliensis TaxID=2315334 RepID=UPI000EF6FFDD|nr:tRNA (uridine(54)-C5)-methyltransferase TrmA [Helicobacter burdigaliensis]